jgi:hypothetical protein
MCFRADGPRGPGGRSARTRRTVRSDQADGPRGVADGLLFVTERGAARWTGRTVRGPPADSPRGPGGRSTVPWRTVRQAQRAVPQPLTSRFYRWNSNADSPRGYRGQSARVSRIVRKARILSLTASNGKGEYLYSKLGVGEPLLAL